MNVWFWVFIAYISLNFLMFVSMVFFERRKLSNVISWIAVLTFLPVFGYLIYIVFGSGLSYRVQKLIANHKLYQVEYDEEIKKYLQEQDSSKELADNESLIKCCYNYGSVLCPKNDVQIFTNGIDKVDALLADLENAKNSINMEYYIFADDHVGKKVMNVLIKKAKQGVHVRFLYDSVGCLRAPRRFFAKLRKAGGEVGEFFPPFAHIRLINLKLNYRNHRKIVVVDGKIAYTGGINIRDDHMGKTKRVSPWRDTHIRITGSGVMALQNVFLNDWRYVKKENFVAKKYIEEGLFPKPEKVDGDTNLQVVCSGPDSRIQKIKETFVKLVTNAKESILIQTPYFIPDSAFATALRIAIASGVKVKIMLPSKPDYHTIFWVSLSYLKEFVMLGAEVYLYDGFLHSKVLVVDSDKLSIGTCNLDNRSFGLNFEDTVIMYGEKINGQYREIFEKDLMSCQTADLNYFKRKRWMTTFLQAIFRLFSPIL